MITFNIYISWCYIFTKGRACPSDGQGLCQTFCLGFESLAGRKLRHFELWPCLTHVDSLFDLTQPVLELTAGSDCAVIFFGKFCWNLPKFHQKNASSQRHFPCFADWSENAEISVKHADFFGYFCPLTFRPPVSLPWPPKHDIMAKFHRNLWKFSSILLCMSPFSVNF